MQLHLGDCLVILPTLAENSIDSIVCDPPYNLTPNFRRWHKPDAAPPKDQDGVFKRHARGFMGKSWDGDGISFNVDIWQQCLRVLKPGGHLLAFGGARTHHRIWCAIEDAGFEVRDTLTWLFGSGFPHSHSVSKAIDKMAGVERPVIGERVLWGCGDAWPTRRSATGAGNQHANDYIAGDGSPKIMTITAPATELAAKWEGWQNALKPAAEYIVLARKPLSEASIAANVVRWGTGALNIDATRIGTEQTTTRLHTLGRYPANVMHDGLDDETWAKYFYCAKPGPAERDIGLSDLRVSYVPQSNGFSTKISDTKRPRANNHPTVKPLALMRYLCRLITPPGGTVLDCFLGSGSTGVAALQEGFDFIGIEKEADYFAIAERRIGHAAPVLLELLTGCSVPDPSALTAP